MKRKIISLYNLGSQSPLTFTDNVVQAIAESLSKDQNRPVVTIDFSIGRFEESLKKALQEASIGDIETLWANLKIWNLDHHDGNNPGATATEVVLQNKELFGIPPSPLILSDQGIDLDNICATYLALNPDKIDSPWGDTLAKVARYGDYLESIDGLPLKIALTINAMIYGKNKFERACSKCTRENQKELFQDILTQLPEIIQNVGKFETYYSKEYEKINNNKSILELAKKTIPLWEEMNSINIKETEITLKKFSGARDILFINGNSDPISIYQTFNEKIVVRYSEKDGIFSYNPVGLNPRSYAQNVSLIGLWEVLRTAENVERKGRGQAPLSSDENWGGREVAGGSSKNPDIGSILPPERVAEITQKYLLTSKNYGDQVYRLEIADNNEGGRI